MEQVALHSVTRPSRGRLRASPLCLECGRAHACNWSGVDVDVSSENGNSTTGIAVGMKTSTDRWVPDEAWRISQPSDVSTTLVDGRPCVGLEHRSSPPVAVRSTQEAE